MLKSIMGIFSWFCIFCPYKIAKTLVRNSQTEIFSENAVKVDLEMAAENVNLVTQVFKQDL